MTSTWLGGLLRHRAGRLAALATGVAVSVALLASLGTFLSSAKATMTTQAVRSIAVDWQVALGRGADPTTVLTTIRSDPGVRAALPVGFATSDGLRASAGPTTRTTGAAKVLGLAPGYSTTFPGEIRPLAGASTVPDGAPPGVPAPALLAQQTASNLAAHVGDAVAVARAGLSPVVVRVVGVVDLPQIDTLFQAVGAPPGTQPSAPPDNVVLVSNAAWHQAFDPLAAINPDLVARQVHVARSHALAPDPAAAYSQVVGAAHHLESRLAGAGIVGNNIGATLDAARQDALYAQVLFVFLGLPGALLAGALTVTVAAAGANRRRREQALLRLRGARAAQVLRLAAVEATVVGIAGAIVGLGAALLIGQLSFGSVGFGASAGGAAVWMALSAMAGLIIAAIAVLMPARRDLREVTVMAGRTAVATAARRERPPLALRLGTDLWMLVGAAVVYAITSHSGYSLVLAPEGVPTISVNYWAFAGPVMFWLGTALLTWRIVDVVLRRGRRFVAWAARPISGRLSALAAATASRQRSLLARASVIAGLALVFAASTAVFNNTYKAQANVDARLTNGADVAVTNFSGNRLPLRDVTGVRSVEPLIHRYAYIGTDLQDLYGVRPATITQATSLQDAYFTGATASQLMGRLAARPDSVLVSAETVKDYQLHLGDQLILRLQDARSQRVLPVRFHYAGIVKEFPTAPHDSFFVTNASYVTKVSGDPSAETVLVNTTGHPHQVADRIRAVVGTGPKITDATTARTAVGSSLTAVDLAGLTRIELGFALILAIAGGGLVLGLGLAERRRDMAIVAALGAGRNQLRALVQVDAAVVTLAALATGIIGGGILAQILVKVLTGVFDPPPASLSIPVPYLLVVTALAVGGIGLASRLVSSRAVRGTTAGLREL